MFVLSSDITIGSFRFGGVHQVRIKRSVHGYVITASIVVPSVCTVTKKNGYTAPQYIVTSKQFADGDKVTIRLGYDGKLVEEFRGFVKRRDLNMPLEIECEGYSYQLRRNNVNGSWKSIQASDLLREAIKGTDIKLRVGNDLELANVLVKDVTGAEVIDFVMKSSGNALNIFFVDHDVLYCGLTYLPSGDGINGAGINSQVKFRLGYNVIKDNSLRERIPNVEVDVRIKTAKTKRDKTKPPPSQEAGKIKSLLLQAVKSPAALAALKSTLERKENYTGYEGKVTAFLIPYCAPGWKAFISDSRYRERDGVYFIESTDVTYGQGGARRICEIGPKLQA